MDQEMYKKRVSMRNDFAAAGAALLDFTATACAIAAVPETEPQLYAAVGTPDDIAKLLPATIGPGRRMRHGDRPTEPLSFEDEAAPVSPVVQAVPADLDKLTRYKPNDGTRHYADFPEGPMVTDSNGQFVKFADVQALLAAPSMAVSPAPRVGEWISVDERKPKGRTPILVAVSFVRYGENEDGTPGEWPGQIVAEGEYVPQHGEAGDYFTCYSSPHGDSDWITHWMPLPSAPAIRSLRSGSETEGEAS